MKRLFIIILALMLSFTASAQWTTRFHKADELKGEDSYWSNLYVSPSGYSMFVCWTNDTEVKIITREGIFDYSDDYVRVLVGFYKGESLVEKEEAYFFVPQGDRDSAYSSSYRNPGLGPKIKEWIKNSGNVRFVAPKFSGADFDMTVKQYKDLK